MGSRHERMQRAEYARLTFNAQRNRRSVLAIGFRQTRDTLFVLDRAGILASRVYDVSEDPEQFLRIAIGILFMNPKALGYDTTFSAMGDKHFVNAGRVKFELTQKIYLDRTIRGRGTVCTRRRASAGASPKFTSSKTPGLTVLGKRRRLIYSSFLRNAI